MIKLDKSTCESHWWPQYDANQNVETTWGAYKGAEM